MLSKYGLGYSSLDILWAIVHKCLGKRVAEARAEHNNELFARCQQLHETKERQLRLQRYPYCQRAHSHEEATPVAWVVVVKTVLWLLRSCCDRASVQGQRSGGCQSSLSFGLPSPRPRLTAPTTTRSYQSLPSRLWRHGLRGWEGRVEMLSVTEVRIELANASKLSPTWRDARLTSIHSSLKAAVTPRESCESPSI
jgi:hypothetical protein